MFSHDDGLHAPRMNELLFVGKLSWGVRKPAKSLTGL